MTLWETMPGADQRSVAPGNFDDWRTQKNAFLDDVNGHLYAWTPLLLRNLLEDAGYSVKLCRVVTTAWHPRFVRAKSALPAALFRVLTWGFETKAVTGKLTELGGTPQTHEVAAVAAENH